MAYPAARTEKPFPFKLAYSNALRCIGQILEPRDLKAVEVKTHGETYVVQGWSKGALTALEIDKHYTAEDIRQLEIDARKRRQADPGTPNLLSLSHVLRLAGNYVDRMRGRLLRISWQDQSDKIQSVTIQYEPSVHERTDDYQATTMEELCIHVYKQRKRFAASADRTAQRPLVHIGLGNQAPLEAVQKPDTDHA